MPLTRLTLGDLANLQVGQVIDFDETAQSRARLSARGQTLFVCEFGKLGQNYTVRIKHPFDAGQDFIDGLMARMGTGIIAFFLAILVGTTTIAIAWFWYRPVLAAGILAAGVIAAAAVYYLGRSRKVAAPMATPSTGTAT